jgi:hypothetical protein
VKTNFKFVERDRGNSRRPARSVVDGQPRPAGAAVAAGSGGGYALDKIYQLPPVNFTAREAALLMRWRGSPPSGS